jgi:hypothetical protein
MVASAMEMTPTTTRCVHTRAVRAAMITPAETARKEAFVAILCVRSVASAVISTRRIIQAHVVARDEADDYWVKATSRRAVRSVLVEERVGLIERESRRDWPGAAAVVVHIAGLPAPLRLAPSVRSAWGGQTPDMYALLNSFLRNLD